MGGSVGSLGKQKRKDSKKGMSEGCLSVQQPWSSSQMEQERKKQGFRKVHLSASPTQIGVNESRA